MAYITTIWSFLKGKKTYIIAGLMILAGFLKGDTDLVWQGFAFAGLRSALQ